MLADLRLRQLIEPGKMPGCRGFIPRQALIQFQVSPRGRVQHQGIAALFHAHGANMWQRRFLRVAHELQQGARRTDRERQLVDTETAQPERAQLIGQRA